MQTEVISIFDVEMEGRSGHTCHVFVQAETSAEAEDVAARQFPELTTTGNTQETHV
jgi:hypothetical protein